MDLDVVTSTLRHTEPVKKSNQVGLIVGLLALVMATGCQSSPETEPTPTPAPSAPASPAPTVAPLEEDDPRAFVTGFMEARIAGDGQDARRYLSAEAVRQFESGENGLALTREFVGWELLSLEAIDSNSFEVQVEIADRSGASFREILFIGVGQDFEGRQRPLVVRGAGRT